ncbi:HAMP domain-containing histidine kinase [Chromobacterium alkanivorans]|uniref:ATP-binding protein n=1 Tax=Chromobacterium alkanivorans TaxID=1071719 RepID=UPI0019686F19|nr:HAMP domain-containing sensor histidine kinase [Chromobacterium alkanivorans]MBN3003859.1 HAMP domain-containing histidine kinase [Chromobacterium alkanivorans]
MLRFVSFRSLLLASFLIVAVVPSAVLIQLRNELGHAASTLRSHQEQAKEWLDANRVSREQSIQFERATRQAQILKDRALANTAAGAWQEIELAQRKLQRGDGDELALSARAILAIQPQLQALPARSGAQRDRLFRQLDLHLTAQGQLINRQLEQSQRQWQDSITEMRRTADRLAWLSLASALALALAMTLLISWPLRKLQAKIARMSDGARLQDWRQSGPADLQRLARELAQLDRRLAALEEQKGRFFRQASHELKTPLAAIHEAAALLREEVIGQLSAQQQEIVAILQNNAQTLRQRVEALLRYDAGQWLSETLTVETFDLPALIADRLQTSRPLLQAKRLTAEVQGDAERVSGDRSKVETILDNLLINAIRHSPAGSALSIRHGRDAGGVWLEISDQGPGVPEACREKIFEPFWSGSPPPGELPGTGLGLAMARGFAQLMRGELTLEPQPQTGTCFRLQWPEPENKT